MKRKTAIFKGADFKAVASVLGINKKTGRVWVKLHGFHAPQTVLVDRQDLTRFF